MKNKTVAGALALFLGGIGIHKFYVGRPFQGIIYLLLCWTFIPALIAFVEAIRFFLMSEKSFIEQYGTTLDKEMLVTTDTHVRCPDCRELIRRDAVKCKHCGAHLVVPPKMAA